MDKSMGGASYGIRGRYNKGRQKCSALLGVLLDLRKAWFPLALVFALAATASAATYVYDANGRLVFITDSSGATARHVYDALGNLTRVERLAAGEVAVFGFHPARGAVDTPVEIQGHGFHVTPANNTVLFNGTPGIVTAASARSLTAKVPPNASTGPISVTVGSQTATSSSVFVVDEAARPPAITAVAPLVVNAGTPIVVTGNKLHPVIGRTDVALNGRDVTPSSLSDSEVVFAVPPGNGSGKVKITTPYGKAFSEQDVLVLPAGIVAADIAVVIRAQGDGPAQSITLPAAGKYAAVLFDGAYPEFLSFQFVGLVADQQIEYSVYNGRNALETSGFVGVAKPSIHLPASSLPQTRLLLLKAVASGAQFDISLERDKTLVADGPPLSLGMLPPGQSKRFVLSTQFGQSLGLGFSNLDVPGTAGYPLVELFHPYGQRIAYDYCYRSTGSCQIDVSTPIAGFYTVIISPSDSALNVEATLSTDITGQLTFGAPTELALRIGQNARYRFSGQAGQGVTIQIENQHSVPANRLVSYKVLKPDGTLLHLEEFREPYSGNDPLATNVYELPVTGEYTLFIDPNEGESYTSRITLQPGISSQLVVDGPGASFETQFYGQGVYLYFDAVQGANLGLGITNLVGIPPHASLGIEVFRPDGNRHGYQTCRPYEGGCQYNFSDLQAGRYKIYLRSYERVSFTAVLSTDLTYALTDGIPQTLTIARAGQNGRITFHAVAGEQELLTTWHQVTAPSERSVVYAIYEPSGALFKSITNTARGMLLQVLPLPYTGTYTIVVDPALGETATLTVARTRASALEIDGALAHAETTHAAQPVFYSMQIPTGTTRVSVGLQNYSVTGETSTSLQVYTPSGVQLQYEGCIQSLGRCDIDLENLVPGTYSVIAYPPYYQPGVMSFDAGLSTEHTANLHSNQPYALSLARPGQNARLGFDVSAGQRVSLQATNQLTTPTGTYVTYLVLGPDGEYIAMLANTTAVWTASLPSATIAGRYTIVVDPQYGALLTTQLTLLTAQPIAVDGSPLTHGSSAPDTGAHFTFNATAGANLGLGLHNILTPGTTDPVLVELYNANATRISYQVCSASEGGCQLNLPNATEGSYDVIVTPPNTGQRTMSFDVTVSSDVSGLLQPDVALPINLTRRGQNGRLTFSGTSGQKVALNVTGQGTGPAGGMVDYIVYRPDESVLQSGSNASATFSLSLGTLPSTGTYTVLIDPRKGETLSAQITRATVVTPSPLVVDGATVNLNTTIAGQTANLTFSTTAGSNLGLGISNLATPNSTGSVLLEVFAPTGTLIASTTCLASNGGCQLNLPNVASGTHNIKVTPPTTGDRKVSFGATLSKDATAVLTLNTQRSLSLNRRGKNARLTFTGNLGQKFKLVVASQATTPAGKTVKYTVYAPSGSSLVTSSTAAASLTITVPDLPATGTYVVVVDPLLGETATMNMTRQAR